MDVRIVAGDQNTPGGIVSASVENINKRRPLVVTLANISGDIYNALGAASGGDGAILDGVSSAIKATVKSTAVANPLHVIITNVSGDTPNLAPPGGADGAITDGAAPSIKATVKDYANSNPLTVVLVNASGDAYNANDVSVTVNKWNLTPGQDSVNIHSGRTGVTGDVSTVPKVGETWPVSFPAGVTVGAITAPAGVSGDVSTIPKSGQTWPTSLAQTVGVNIVGGSIGGRISISGDSLVVTATDLDIRNLNPNQDSLLIYGGVIGGTGDFSTTPKAGQIWPVREQGVVGVQVVGGGVNRVSVSGDQLNVVQQGAWSVGVSGDISTTPAAGKTWPTQPQSVLGVQIVGGLNTRISASGDFDIRDLNPLQDTVRVQGGLIGVTGDRSITDGVDASVKATVKDYANSNPLAVALTNASGDTYNPYPKERILLTVAGRVTSAGSNSIVAAAGGRKIKVTAYDFQGDGDNARGFFASGASGTQLTPEWELASREGVAKHVGGVDGGYLFATTTGQALSFESSSARAMKYAVTYHVEDAS